MQKISYLGQTIRKWQIGPSSFVAIPELGARLMNWHVGYADGTIRDIIHWPELDALDDFPKIRGGNPILFPFSGQSFDGGKAGRWRAEDGISRPMPQHGFARQGKFEVTEENGHGFTALFQPDAEAEAAYPFHYRFAVSYRFETAAFYVELRLKNLDVKPISWSPGHHFYFSMTGTPGLSRKDTVVEIPSAKAWRQGKDGSLLPLADPSKEASLLNPDLFNRIHTDLKNNLVTLRKKETSEAILIRMALQGKALREAAVVTWAETDDSPYYCVEPWMGPPNSPEHKIGLHTVEPGKTASFLIEVRLDTSS